MNFFEFHKFCKVSTPKISQNALIAKISTCKKTSKFQKQIKNKLLKKNKLLLKRLQMFSIFWTHLSK